MKCHDVIIIGAGPAGCATAVFLRGKGCDVLLLDQARFPRDKVCGEFISPAADAILDELGVLERIEALQPRRLNGVYISAYGQSELFVDYPPMPGCTGAVSSLSLPRRALDQALFERARSCGVDIREEHKVYDLLFENGNVCGVKGWDCGKTSFAFKASLVVDAGGRNAVSTRRLALKRPADKGFGGKTAIAAHWQDTRSLRSYCYMHVSNPGYTGIAAVGGDLVNTVLVVDTVLLKGRDIGDFYTRTLLANPQRRDLLDGASLVEEPRTVDSLAYFVDPPPCGGLVLVGDATGFIDPFTGEGIYLSLRSAQIAARVIDSALNRGDFSREYLARYDRERREEFRARFRLSRILQKLIYNQPLCAQVVRILSENQSLAQLLVGAIGDYLPAESVVSWKYLAKLTAGFFIWQRTVRPEMQREEPAEEKSLPPVFK